MCESGTVSRVQVFEAVLDAILEGVIITGPDLDSPGPRIEYVNPAFTRMTGYAHDEVVGRTPRILQGPATDRSVLDRLRRDLQEQGSFSGETVNYRKDGSTYIVEWVISAVRGEDGKPRFWVSALRDVTERRRLEDSNRQLIAELQDRVRNVLAVVATITRRTRATTAPDALGDRLQRRIEGFAITQGLITRDLCAGVDLGELVEAQLDELELEGEGRVSVAGPRLRLAAKAAEMIGAALHELAANALAHGALRQAEGRVAVNWSIADGGDERTLAIEWVETGLPAPVEPSPKRGMGFEVVEQGLSYALQASTTLAFSPGRFRCRMCIPMSGGMISVE